MTLLCRLAVLAVGLLALSDSSRAQEGVPPNPAADAVLQRLVGEWRMIGQVMGDSVQYDLTVRRVLMGRFVELHMRDVARPPAYEARVVIGADSSVAPRVIAHWMDSFGAAYSVPAGYGTAQGDSIAFFIAYSSGTFRDVLSANSDGTWRLLIESQDGNAWRSFADYRIVPVMVAPASGPRDSLVGDVPPRMQSPGVFSTQLSRFATRMLSQDETLEGRELRVVVAFNVTEDGSVEAAVVDNSSGNPVFDAEALRLIQVTRFHPGTRNGRPVTSRARQPVRFVFER